MGFPPSYSTVDPPTRDRRENFTREEEPRQESGGRVPGEALDPPSPPRVSASEDKTLTALALALRSATAKARRRGPRVFKTANYRTQFSETRLNRRNVEVATLELATLGPRWNVERRSQGFWSAFS